MFNEPIRKVASDEPRAAGPASDVPAAGAPAALPPVDLAADAELVLAAIHRIEKAIYNGHASPPMQRLGRQIADLAADIAEARLSFELDREYGARTTDMEALLQRLEARVSAMQAIAAADPRPASAGGGRAAATDERAPDPVPTVSHVVSLLGQTDEWGSADAEPYEPPVGRPPSLAMLEAMVEALTVAPPPPAITAPAIEAENIPPDDTEVEHVEVEHVEAQSAELDAHASNEAPPDAAAVTADEDDLFTSFARMEAVPYLPQEIGTAVIFSARDGADAGPAADAGGQGAAAAGTESPAHRLVLSGAAAVARAPTAATMSARVLALGADASWPDQRSADDATASDGANDAETETAALRFTWPASAAASNSDTDSEITSRNADARQPGDPLAPLRGLSRAETLALFS